MTKEEKNEVKYVSINTMMIAAIVCLVAGFLGGVVYSTYKSGSGMTGQSGAYATQPAGGPGITTQQRSQIFTLEKSVSENPNNVDAWMQLGNLYFDTNNFQKSIDSYKKYLAVKPDNPNVWTDLGVMYRRSGSPQEALAAFDKAIELDPRHEQPRFNKGIVLLHDLQDSEAAVRVWKELAEINPSFKAPGGQAIQEFIKKQ